ncbi:pyrimidine 5'-nucleotidase [Zopfochytrium polystomum]|nr:pyrimidine 5'-nucleotidase [Zopfochytrium polystomum]
MTVTRYWQNGERSPSSHAVLMRSEATGPEFKRRSDELYHKYYPIEIDSTLPYEVRRQAMEDWWVQAHQVIVDAKLTRPDLTRMVAATPVAYRDGVRELFAACAARDIPVLVFSAGLYDVIKEILEAAALKPPNVHIVSNRMQFDPDTGVCTSFASPLIHVFNKNEAKIAGSPYEASLAGRSRVLLMGDSLGDLQMGDGIACETLLTVGFLNHDTEKHLSAYTAAFDVVVIDDAPMDFANRIVEGFKEVATRVAAAAAAAATAGVNGTGAV